MKIKLNEDFLDFVKGTEVYFERRLCYGVNKKGDDETYCLIVMVIKDQEHKVELFDDYFRKHGHLPKLKLVIED